MVFARIVLGFFGLSFLGFGIWALVDPESMIPFIHFNLDHPVARTEFRAFYGGLEIGLGLYLLACMRTEQWAVGGAAVLAAISAGIGFGRLIGIGVDGSGGGFIYAALVWELGGAALAFLAFRLVRWK